MLGLQYKLQLLNHSLSSGKLQTNFNPVFDCSACVLRVSNLIVPALSYYFYSYSKVEKPVFLEHFYFSYTQCVCSVS